MSADGDDVDDGDATAQCMRDPARVAAKMCSPGDAPPAGYIPGGTASSAAGADAVMADGSSLSFEDNVAWTARMAAAAHAAGATVEAELGKLAGEEDGLSVNLRDAKMTDPAAVAAFLQATAVDALALSTRSARSTLTLDSPPSPSPPGSFSPASRSPSRSRVDAREPSLIDGPSARTAPRSSLAIATRSSSPSDASPPRVFARRVPPPPPKQHASDANVRDRRSDVDARPPSIARNARRAGIARGRGHRSTTTTPRELNADANANADAPPTVRDARETRARHARAPLAFLSLASLSRARRARARRRLTRRIRRHIDAFARAPSPRVARAASDRILEDIVVVVADLVGVRSSRAREREAR